MNDLFNYTGYDDPPEEGEVLSYGDLSSTEEIKEGTLQFIMPRHTVGSDYSGDAVEKSNYRSIIRDFKDNKDVHKVTGGMGTFGVAFRVPLSEELQEVVDNLEGYPLYDESDLCELEEEIKNEDYDSCVRSEFEEALKKAFDVDELDEVIDDDLDELFYTYKEATDTEWVIETGCTSYINIEPIVDAIVEVKRLEGIDSYEELLRYESPLDDVREEMQIQRVIRCPKKELLKLMGRVRGYAAEVLNARLRDETSTRTYYGELFRSVVETQFVRLCPYSALSDFPVSSEKAEQMKERRIAEYKEIEQMLAAWKGQPTLT